jgi:hypothetical protein
MFKLNLDHKTQQKLKQVLPSPYNFLGYTLSLNTNALTDHFTSASDKEEAGKLVETILIHYACGTQVPLTGELIKFKDLPGGHAYDIAFINRAVKPVEKSFGEKPTLLTEAARLLGGRSAKIADASITFCALKGIPLTYLLYTSEEFPPCANILYDKSATAYLPTEDLAVLGELATLRLIAAKECSNKRNEN